MGIRKRVDPEDLKVVEEFETLVIKETTRFGHKSEPRKEALAYVRETQPDLHHKYRAAVRRVPLSQKFSHRQFAGRVSQD